MESIFHSLQPLLIAVFVAINAFSFFIMANDKRKSTRANPSSHPHSHRTPEGILFFLATAFGAIGIFLAMHLLRHKTKKWYFQVGIPLLIIQNLATVYLLSNIVMDVTQ